MLCLQKTQKLFMFDLIFLFQTNFTTLLASNIPLSLLSRFWESNSDVKWDILDDIPTGSRWCSGNRAEIEVSLIIPVSTDEVSTASTTKIKINKETENNRSTINYTQ